MEMSMTAITSEKTTEGASDTHGHDYTLSDKHRLRSLLLRESDNRGESWSHLFKIPELPLMCCENPDIRVHINVCQEHPWKVTAETVTHDEDFHRILSDEYRAIFVFIDSQEQASGKLSLSWAMLPKLLTILDVTPEFSDFLPWRTNNHVSRNSTSGGFASSTKAGVGDMSLSFYHCCIQRSDSGEEHSASVAKAIFNIQVQREKLHWIVIGSPVLQDLQTVYLDVALQEVFKQSPTFFVFIATNGWQTMLSLIEDDLTTELNIKRDLNDDSNHTKWIGALLRLQSQLLNATWQIEANLSVLRSLAEVYASRRVDAILISTALGDLKRGVARAEFLTRQVHSAMNEATYMTTHKHATRLDAFSWYNLKLNYAVESGTRQTTVIFALLAPAIFTSTLFSTNFFSLSANGSTLHSQSLWIWFATTVPLTILFLSLVYIWNKWRTGGLNLIRHSRANHSDVDNEAIV